jgi:hypothetical protein
MKIKDYFAELYVAGRLADAGWNIYFPHRDEGFDFVISKTIDGMPLLRPVQVKGKYPSDEKGDKVVYGYVGRLTQTHPEMVLAIPYFSGTAAVPCCVAYMPMIAVRTHNRGFRCQPASYKGTLARPRRDYLKFFDEAGIKRLDSIMWSQESVAELS